MNRNTASVKRDQWAGYCQHEETITIDDVEYCMQCDSFSDEEGWDAPEYLQTRPSAQDKVIMVLEKRFEDEKWRISYEKLQISIPHSPQKAMIEYNKFLHKTNFFPVELHGDNDSGGWVTQRPFYAEEQKKSQQQHSTCLFFTQRKAREREGWLRRLLLRLEEEQKSILIQKVI